jgi:hypothetical protein
MSRIDTGERAQPRRRAEPAHRGDGQGEMLCAAGPRAARTVPRLRREDVAGVCVIGHQLEKSSIERESRSSLATTSADASPRSSARGPPGHRDDEDPANSQHPRSYGPMPATPLALSSDRPSLRIQSAPLSLLSVETRTPMTHRAGEPPVRPSRRGRAGTGVTLIYESSRSRMPDGM